MDQLEIVVPRANGEAVFSWLMEKMAFRLKMDKMANDRQVLSATFIQASLLSKEWGEGQCEERKGKVNTEKVVNLLIKLSQRISGSKHRGIH